ncbi:MAG: CrcB family protein [Actinobacteria bacterium]|jgi:CrcB protein|nr:CrcB family protein [Actinomycetota bacterium]
MPTLALVALGGALGALARAAVVSGFGEHPWWGTLAVNIVGCLAIGYLLVVLRGSPRADAWMPFAVTGVLGGFTTFSALALDTVVLLDTEPATAAVYLGATLVVGLLAVPLGEILAGRR